MINEKDINLFIRSNHKMKQSSQNEMKSTPTNNKE